MLTWYQRIWTDDIVLPSIYRHVGSNARQHLPISYRLLRLDSEVNRAELGLSSGDTSLCVSFRSDSLEGIWADIWNPTATINKSAEGAWKTLIDSWWGLEMDMNYIPTETFQLGVSVIIEEDEAGLERGADTTTHGGRGGDWIPMTRLMRAIGCTLTG
ncbi:hypothetical protein V496_01352 [Pseudogymnoascus sp. VKM F-4515 (FW-2607)]|nr:hypothetical protein V496_01352 [Pseudogymnoascus sp. VKM F-4515 (FW-2607)]